MESGLFKGRKVASYEPACFVSEACCVSARRVTGTLTAVAPCVQSFHRAVMDDRERRLARAAFGASKRQFRNLKGVTATAVGYAGGTKENPSYEDVCTDETGHAEVVEVEFDPSQVSYEELLDIFWSNHNPTTLNRQGPDVGTQYRSVVFYHSPEQKAAAQAAKDKIDKSGRFPRPVVTQIEPAPKFWRAEEYHQRYLEKRGQSHCAI